MSQAHLIRTLNMEKQIKALSDRIFRLEAAMQSLADKPKEREWPTSRKS